VAQVDEDECVEICKRIKDESSSSIFEVRVCYCY